MRFPSIPSRFDRQGAAARRRAVIRALACAATALFLLGLSVAARAEDGANVKRAQALYKEGEAAFNERRFDEALAAWQRGYELAPRPGFIVNMAHAERKRGELRSAVALYRRYLVMEPDSPLREEVEQVIAELEPESAAPQKTSMASLPRTLDPPASALPAALVERPGASPPPPFYKRWWFWTATGIAAAAVTTAVLLGTRPDHERSGTLGTLR